MIGFVIGQVEFQQRHAVVDGVNQPQAPDQRMDGSDPTHVDAARALGDLIMDVACSEHGLIATAQVKPIKAPLDGPLALSQFLVYAGVHSKSLLAVGVWKALHSLKHRKRREISSFFMKFPRRTPGGRLAKV